MVKNKTWGNGDLNNFHSVYITAQSCNSLRVRVAIVLNLNIYTYIITTEDTENTEGMCLYFLYSVSSVLSVVKFSLKIGEGIWVIDYNHDSGLFLR